MKHPFTPKIITEIDNIYPGSGQTIFELSPLIQYLNQKTRSANRGSKSRSSFANLYALYVLIDDYISKGYLNGGDYSKYEGADFSPLLRKIRAMPFGSKLQNHALNSRLNDEFHKYFPEDPRRPIIRKVDAQKYWINESLLKVKIAGKEINLARSILNIVSLYISTKRESFDEFIKDCERIKDVSITDGTGAPEFIRSLLAPEKDARLFEIVSYAILRAHFSGEIIFIGDSRESVKEEPLVLFKTGRTNANDGGIDFVMKPLGRFFQVTETLDVKKYFLDIDKIEKFPISFVIKTTLSEADILNRLRIGAKEQYGVEEVIEKYMTSIEEVFNIQRLNGIFDALVAQERAHEVLDEIIRWSKVEFNIEESTDAEATVADTDEESEE